MVGIQPEPCRGASEESTTAEEASLIFAVPAEAGTAQSLLQSTNVHAPSGKEHRLKDSQGKTLLTNLLQSNSGEMPGRTVGNTRFVIGGDMNTAPFLTSQLLQQCRNNGALHTALTEDK